jgi:hypothetical protein
MSSTMKKYQALPMVNNHTINRRINDGIHEIDEKTLLGYEKDLADILTKGTPVKVSHLKVNAPKAITFNRVLNLEKGTEYHRRQNSFKQPLHWGQLKLMLTEVEFLTKIVQDNTDNKPIYFVYAGAAPGHHIYYLQKLFPMVNFELYDPNDFVVKDNDTLHTHVQFFMDDDAKNWRERVETDNIYLAFCSDIRTEPATSENIVRNMAMQLGWWKIMNPELSMFKFRLPWENGETEYPEGDIYVQPYPGPTSTETRLVVKKNAPLKLYSNRKYEEACFYHNSVSRQMYYPSKLGNLNIQRDGIDNCYDCVAFAHIAEEYIACMQSKLSVRQVVADIQKNTTFGRHNIFSQTVASFNRALDTFRRMCYSKCRNNRCGICTAGLAEENPLAKDFSKATIENEVAYVSGVVIPKKKKLYIKKPID